MLKDYLFTDLHTDEDFFVETTDEAHAWVILNQEFGERYVQKYLEFVEVCTVEQAETMGLDTF